MHAPDTLESHGARAWARILQGLCLLAMLSGACAQAGAVMEPLELSTSIVGSSTFLLPRLSTFFPPGTFFGNGTVVLGQTVFRHVPAFDLPHVLDLWMPGAPSALAPFQQCLRMHESHPSV